MQIPMVLRLLRARFWPLALLAATLALPLTTLATPVPQAGRPAPGTAALTSVADVRQGSRPYQGRPMRAAIEPFVRPDLARRMERLRPAILAAARRHNRPELSGMDDEAFAAVIAVVIYNENFGWLEDDIAPLRVFTPLYQDLQRRANESLPGSNFSVWPTNLRPSVAVEILQQRLPLAGGEVITVPVGVVGSRIDLARYPDQEALFAAITAEISRDDLAVAYLAANLERGLYRAAREGAPVSWRTLAAWHNQGLVDPRAIRANPTARDYLRRASAYLPLARAFVAARSSPWPPMGRE